MQGRFSTSFALARKFRVQCLGVEWQMTCACMHYIGRQSAGRVAQGTVRHLAAGSWRKLPGSMQSCFPSSQLCNCTRTPAAAWIRIPVLRILYRCGCAPADVTTETHQEYKLNRLQSAGCSVVCSRCAARHVDASSRKPATPSTEQVLAPSHVKPRLNGFGEPKLRQLRPQTEST